MGSIEVRDDMAEIMLVGYDTNILQDWLILAILCQCKLLEKKCPY